MSDHRRMLATLSFADDKATAERLLDALWAWRKAANDFDPPAPIRLPSPDEIELESVQLPRDAFFGHVEAVPAEKASGRIAAEQITPYPPGIPAVVPGERLNDAVIDYLRSGLNAGMNVPDAADTTAGDLPGGGYLIPVVSPRAVLATLLNESVRSDDTQRVGMAMGFSHRSESVSVVAQGSEGGGAALDQVIGMSVVALVVTAGLLWIGYLHRQRRITWLNNLAE